MTSGPPLTFNNKPWKDTAKYPRENNTRTPRNTPGKEKRQISLPLNTPRPSSTSTSPRTAPLPPRKRPRGSVKIWSKSYGARNSSCRPWRRREKWACWWIATCDRRGPSSGCGCIWAAWKSRWGRRTSGGTWRRSARVVAQCCRRSFAPLWPCSTAPGGSGLEVQIFGYAF